MKQIDSVMTIKPIINLRSRFIKACSVCCVFAHTENILAEAPIKAKHLIVHLYSSTNLALPEPLADFLDSIPIAGIGGKQFAAPMGFEPVFQPV